MDTHTTRRSNQQVAAYQDFFYGVEKRGQTLSLLLKWVLTLII